MLKVLMTLAGLAVLFLLFLIGSVILGLFLALVTMLLKIILGACAVLVVLWLITHVARAIRSR
jgi:hypothetical protein